MEGKRRKELVEGFRLVASSSSCRPSIPPFLLLDQAVASEERDKVGDLEVLKGSQLEQYQVGNITSHETSQITVVERKIVNSLLSTVLLRAKELESQTLKYPMTAQCDLWSPLC